MPYSSILSAIVPEVQSIIATLKANNHTLSFAESCTGGGIASVFTSVAGVSAVFGGSCVTYSNTIKEQWLGVSPQTLLRYGAVSQECVAQMLVGITTMANSEYNIAVSGIAGPDGGTNLKPVGTVYIGIQTPLGQQIQHCKFEGNRQEIQEKSIIFAIKTLKEAIENKNNL
ncbi:MAG: CinA family protein [Sulfurovum sp.]|nr:CinA family protein [Sulfurovum sp.]